MCDCASLPYSFKFRSHFHLQQTSKFNVQFPSKFIPNPSIRVSQRNPRSSSKETTDNSPGDDPFRGDDQKRSSASFDFLELKRELEKEDELVPVEGLGNENDGGSRVRRGGKRQMMRRSSLLAKQVISVRTARSLGFVSQLWVDTDSWMVVLVEVRPNLLSGDIEKFLLEDICQLVAQQDATCWSAMQHFSVTSSGLSGLETMSYLVSEMVGDPWVGDVVLVPDESVMENDLKMIGLNTLVGCNVMTSGRRNVGKVRGYTFNINSGAVESLELDSFGVSIIPSSLVSTYCLFVEDVLEVASDTVTVHEGAASRLQRVTKGIWDTHNADKPRDDIDEYYDFGRQSNRSFRSRRSQSSSSGKFPQKMRVEDDDWELPMDF